MGCCSAPPQFEGPFGDKLNLIYNHLQKIDSVTKRYINLFDFKSNVEFSVNINSQVDKYFDYQNSMMTLDKPCQEIVRTLNELDKTLTEDQKDKHNEEEYKQKNDAKKEIEVYAPIKMQEYFLRTVGMKPEDNPKDLTGQFTKTGVKVPVSIRNAMVKKQ